MRKHHVTAKTGTEKTGMTGTAPVSGRGETFGDSVLSTISDMERAMEDTLLPMFGWRMSPMRHFFTDRLTGGGFVPALDLMETEKEIVVRAELPGTKREDIHVRLVDHDLIISGEKRSEERVERRDYLRMERTHGTFQRTLRLPPGIDGSHIAAALKDGILEVRIPKMAEKESGRHITIG